jgi:hypothetical protein
MLHLDGDAPLRPFDADPGGAGKWSRAGAQLDRFTFSQFRTSTVSDDAGPTEGYGGAKLKATEVAQGSAA